MFYSVNITCFAMYLPFETLSNGNIKKEGNGHSFPLPLAKYRYIGVQIAFWVYSTKRCRYREG